jgi:hypothetical protein
MRRDRLPRAPRRRRRLGRRWTGLLAAVLVAGLPARGAAQTQMPNPKEISGVPLPSTDEPVGTVSVRVIRGDFSHNLANQPVTFTVDGKPRTVKTDENGRAAVSGLTPGTQVKAVTVVDGERLESQDITIAASGIRVVLAATDPDAAKREAENAKLAAGPAVKGIVVFGPESRVVAEMNEDQLNIFYVLDILNTARTPVDIGGPLLMDLPREARGASVIEGPANQAAVSGTHLTINGPFAPGSTTVQVGFELPYEGATAQLSQTWPAPLQQVTVLVAQSGGLGLQSPQLSAKQQVADQGQPLIFGSGPALPSGRPLEIEISGLPHHALWPRYLALALACSVMSLGIWAAVFTKPRRRRR